ncbi:MAG: hypothetical protein M1528_00170 [Candidatus Marsarchaeota archaeon]|nr:hypothetical protein [Candidatus Marsarchaeota archaeon]MCL5114947.1 hypothetical protein [Candidatus Marsarchaeota archaeon]
MIRTKTWIMVLIAALALSGIAVAGTSGPSPIPNPPTFSITTNSLVFCRGETNYVPITVTDGGPAGPSYPSIGVSNLTGTAMTQVELSVSPGKGILPESVGTVYIGVVHANNSSTTDIPLFVSSNASLITSIGIQIQYAYDALYTDSETRNLTFEVVSCGSPLAVSVNPKTVTSGEIQNLSINFTNSGNTTLSNLYVHYGVPGVDGAVVGSTQAELGDLKPQSTDRLNVSIFVSRNASIESFPLNLTATFYKGDNLEQISNSTSLIPIGSIDLLSSGLTLSPTVVSQGGIVSISFVLTDIGTSGASAVSVGAVVPNGFSSFSSNPVYVGDISADSQAPVTISLVAANTLKPGSYKIPLKISYLNSLRQNITTTSMVNVTVSSGSSYRAVASGAPVAGRESSGLLPLTVLLALALVCVSYLFLKERRKGRRHREAKE